MVQLWVNLPARDKMTPPAYQAIRNADVPVVDLPGGAGSVRVIAGACDGRQGPARTRSPMNVWDLRLVSDGHGSLALPDGWTGSIAVLHGTVLVNGDVIAREGQMVEFDRVGRDVSIEANTDAVLLVLSGEPIDEPIVGYGPFVMNSEEEIVQAFDDFKHGRLAGVVPMDTGAVASELQKTWNREDALEWAQVYTRIFPAYQLLIESYAKAQDVAKNGEALDSQRR